MTQPHLPPLRPLFVDRGLNFHGGISKMLLNLAGCADAEGIEMQVACLQEPSADMVQALQRLGVSVNHLGDHNPLSSALGLRRLSVRDRRTIVATSFRAYLLAKLAVAGRRQRVVYWIHNIGQVAGHGLKARLYRALSRDDTLIFISEAVRRANLPDGHRGSAEVIYNGVEPASAHSPWAPYAASRRAEFGLEADANVLLYIASFEPYKDHRTLLLAFDDLWSSHPQARLLLVGQGSEQSAMQELAASLSSGAAVQFLGSRPDARALLGLADLYVHPCYEEGFGLAVVEAMLAGVPVVAARSGGLPEVVEDAVSGLLFEPQNPADLAEKLRWALDQPHRMEAFAVAGLLRALDRFSPRTFARRLAEVLAAEHTRAHQPTKQVNA